MNPLKKLGLTQRDIISVSPYPTSCRLHLRNGKKIDIEGVSYWKDYSEFNEYTIRKGAIRDTPSKYKCIRNLIKELEQ